METFYFICNAIPLPRIIPHQSPKCKNALGICQLRTLKHISHCARAHLHRCRLCLCHTHTSRALIRISGTHNMSDVRCCLACADARPQPHSECTTCCQSKLFHSEMPCALGTMCCCVLLLYWGPCIVQTNRTRSSRCMLIVEATSIQATGIQLDLNKKLNAICLRLHKNNMCVYMWITHRARKRAYNHSAKGI